MQERTKLEHSITLCNDVEAELNDNIELIELGELEEDVEIIQEAEKAIDKLTDKAGELELQTLLSGEADANHAYLEINSGLAARKVRIGQICYCVCTRVGPMLIIVRSD